MWKWNHHKNWSQKVVGKNLVFVKFWKVFQPVLSDLISWNRLHNFLFWIPFFNVLEFVVLVVINNISGSFQNCLVFHIWTNSNSCFWCRGLQLYICFINTWFSFYNLVNNSLSKRWKMSFSVISFYHFTHLIISEIFRI